MNVRNKLTHPNQRTDSETWRTGKVRLLMTVLQDWVFDRQAHPARFQQAIYAQVPPPVPRRLSTTGSQSSQTSLNGGWVGALGVFFMVVLQHFFVAHITLQS